MTASLVWIAIACVLGGLIDAVTGAGAGRETVAVIEAAYRSAESGEPVNLSELVGEEATN